MKKKYYLSICIPTYNRKEFLLATLDNISKFKEFGEVEIVILDDASTDGTKDLVTSYIKKNKFKNIKYEKFNKRKYFDKMVLAIVKKASAEFCWLISDDDTPLPGSLLKIKNIVQKYPELSFIHMNYVRFDNLLKKVTAKRMVGSITKDLMFNNADDFFFYPINNSYFKYLGTNTITMSTDVFNRRKWLQSSKNANKFIGHNFIHSFVISELIIKYPKIYYLGKPYVQYLSNNHRVWPNDIWKDYNGKFLDHLIQIGFSKPRVVEMRKAQKQYEQREGIMKNKLLKYLYKVLRPVYALYQYLLLKINEK